ncbi:MAG: ribonuclease III [Peptococcaceae bacterium]|jgi:ribonuclease-3|nr:ribonuclease III [Peptococcaceae bacterium]
MTAEKKNVAAGILQIGRKLGMSEKGLGELKHAFTHPTYFEGAKHHAWEDNQRLEFLGDAVLGAIMGEYFYAAYPEVDEGYLTRMRASVVCEGSLAMAAERLGLGDALMMGNGAVRREEGKRPSVLADTFEAVLGALYLDQGFEAAKKFVLKELAFAIASVDQYHTRDYKSTLQELVQKVNLGPVMYLLLEDWGPDHDKSYRVGVYYREELIGVGEGKSKKEAEQQSAKDALEKQTNWKHLLKENTKEK